MPSAPHRDLDRLLDGLQPAAVESVVWGDGALPLQLSAYLTGRQPPEPLITSVRAVLLHGDEVMVLTSRDGGRHVIPGGRREAGESLDATLRRELLEETGWAPAPPAPFGFVHLHYLCPRPPDFAYPHPHAFWLVRLAEAVSHHPEQVQSPDESEWELGSAFMPVATARQLDLGPLSHAFLDAARTARDRAR